MVRVGWSHCVPITNEKPNDISQLTMHHSEWTLLGAERTGGACRFWTNLRLFGVLVQGEDVSKFHVAHGVTYADGSQGVGGR